MRRIWVRTAVRAGVAVYIIVVGIVVWAVLQSWGLSASSAAAVGVIVSALLLAAFLVSVRRARGGSYSAIAGPQWDIAALSAMPAAIVAAIIWVVMFNGGAATAGAVALGVFVGLGLWHRSQAAKEMGKHLRLPMRLDDFHHVEQMIQHCRQTLRDEPLDTEQRTIMKINLAHALIARSVLSGREDGLPEAVRLIEHMVVDQSPVNGALCLIAAQNLVDAMSLKADRTGDLTGYKEAVDLQVDIAADALPSALSRALDDRADYFMMRFARWSSVADGRTLQEHEEAVAYREAITRDLRDAVAATPKRSPIYLERVSKLSWFTGANGGRAELDAAITGCRQALRSARHRRFRDRAIGYICLTELLKTRAEQDVSQRVTDLAEAEQLCRRLLARRNTPLAASASETLAGVLALRHPPPAGREVLTGIGEAYRDAFERQSQSSLAGASRVAAAWADWATRQGDKEEAAEAHLRWLMAVVSESKRRFLRVEHERHLSKVQGLAANAGCWLLAAGRVRDAAVAVELGRAVLLTEAMQRDRGELGHGLLNAGLNDLHERWQDVAPRVAQADRAGYEPGPPIGRLGPNVQPHQARFISREHEALADYDAILREIGRHPGFEDVDVDASLGYEDLGRIAAAEGPLIYIGAAEPHGYAVIITKAPEPLEVCLPQLTTAELHTRVTALLDSPVEWWRGELADVLDWLHNAVIDKLSPHLPCQALVTLVPLGALSLLPLHAAGATADADGIWRNRLDDVAFRYAPNARALGRAQATAAILDPGEVSVLTVDVSHAPGASRLSHAAIESSAVKAQFDDRVVRRLPNARHGDVLAWLEQYTVWHFACHGREVPNEPLKSALLLADDPLTLGELLARPAGRHRLAVLSACETALPNRQLLDEVVSLPGALLQAGVAGVVATQAKVDDQAAMLLVQGFFQRFRQGVAPARALADAQTWLRTSTNARLHADLPAYYPRPPGISTAELGEWKSEYPFSHPAAWAPFSYTGA